MSFATEHLNGCTPMTPCNNCQAVDVIRNGLSSDQLRIFLELIGGGSPAPSEELAAPETPLWDIKGVPQLSNRVRSCLMDHGITTLESLLDLMKKSDAEILTIPRLGRGSLRELRSSMSEFQP